MSDGDRRPAAAAEPAEAAPSTPRAATLLAAGAAREESLKPVLEVTTVNCDGALCVVAEGELDLATAALLNDALLAAEATGAPEILLDIEAVTFIDSSGLRLLLEAHARSRRDGDRLRMTRGTPAAQRLFALVSADGRLPFVDH